LITTQEKRTCLFTADSHLATMPGPAATRPSNKNKHAVLKAKKVTQSRRPTQEVQAEKHAKEQEKIQKEGKKKAGQIEAARLEQEA